MARAAKTTSDVTEKPAKAPPAKARSQTAGAPKSAPAQAKPKRAAANADALAAYRAKRAFDRTPEPGLEDAPPPRKRAKAAPESSTADAAPSPARERAAKPAGFGEFVIQKHDARRLHYDLRLEMDGVLMSWAVTRGPSLVPGEKRLAVHTEDHPMKYLDFEGVIPAGEYGGGTMIVWDRGRWTPEFDPHKGMAKGHLEFSLEGSRLHGRWHLVRMKPRPKEKKEQWLLIKGEDEFARTPDEPDILEQEQTSFISGLTNEELAKRGETRPDHAAREQKRSAPDTVVKGKAAVKGRSAKPDTPAKPAPAPKLKGARKGLLPVFVEPMLATLTADPPVGGDWIHEIKFDGYRTQARIDGQELKLLTRKGLDWTHRFPAIAETLRGLPVGSALIDGEIIVETGNGVPDFSALQADLSAGRHDRMVYYVFDLLYLEGADLRSAALADRKEQLAKLVAQLPEGSNVRFSEHVENDGHSMFVHSCRLGLEGVVSKQRDASYSSGRGHGWFKSKCVQRQELVVIGFTPSTAAKKSIGSLVLGYHEDGRMVLAGRVGTGFSGEDAGRLHEGLSSIATKTMPLAQKPTTAAAKGVTWVEPRLVAEVEFRGWTADGMLRQASFKGLREDKPAEEVTREDAPAADPAPEPAALDLSGIRLTHPERILWEEQGITKQGLAEFYAGIADWVLPHLINRPLSLVRCPSGAAKQCFFQKHRWEGLSPDIHPIDVGDAEPMTYIEDLRGLIGLVQAGVLEIHPWGSRIDNLDHPDRLIFDLDPDEGVTWDAVVDGVLTLRRRLDTMGLKSFVKTSGGKGLHVVLPIEPVTDWDTAKAFTKDVVEAMAAAEPERYVAVMSKAKRKGKIFLDYLRNGRGATAVAAYSTRARAGAPVSTPIGWDELSDAIRADHFSVTNLRQRLDYLAKDPWEGFFTVKQRLPVGANGAKPARAGRRKSKA